MGLGQSCAVSTPVAVRELEVLFRRGKGRWETWSEGSRRKQEGL